MARVGASSLGEAALPAGGVELGRFVAGDGLLHPVALAAIAVLLLNDHVLKAAWPGPVTGKISDFAGLVFFPLLLQAGWEVGGSLVGRGRIGSKELLVVAVAATGAVFIAIKVWPDVNHAVALAMGSGQWLVGRFAGIAPDHVAAVSMALDPTDLIALPSLALAYVIGARRCR